MEKKRLFVDMDGTLTEFHPATEKVLNTEGYFAGLKPHSNVVSAVNMLVKNSKTLEVYILSAVLDNPYAAKEKRIWLKEHLPGIPENRILFVPCGANKGNYVPEGIREHDFLLDDFSKNLHAWEGSGIKLRNAINGTKGTWKGDSVRYNSTAACIAASIETIIMK